MILRSLLLLLFLFQASFFPLLFGEYYTIKQKIEKTDSKSKPVKADALEEDKDESESEKHFVFYQNKTIKFFQNKFLNFYINEGSFFDLPSFSQLSVPIILWVQNFRI